MIADEAEREHGRKHRSHNSKDKDKGKDKGKESGSRKRDDNRKDGDREHKHRHHKERSKHDRDGKDERKKKIQSLSSSSSELDGSEGSHKHNVAGRSEASQGEKEKATSRDDRTPTLVGRRAPSSSTPAIPAASSHVATLTPSQSSAAILSSAVKSAPSAASPKSARRATIVVVVPEHLGDILAMFSTIPESDRQGIHTALARIYANTFRDQRAFSPSTAVLHPIIQSLHHLQFVTDINTSVFAALILSNVFLRDDCDLTREAPLSNWDIVDWLSYSQLPAWWVGYYWQKDDAFPTKFNKSDEMQIKLRLEEVDDHVLELLGQGSDAHGKFTVEGSVHLITKIFKMRKWYTKGGSGKISSKFRGKVDDLGAVGTWGEEAHGGTFRMRPANREEVRDQIEREKLSKETSKSLERELECRGAISESISRSRQFLHSPSSSGGSSSSTEASPRPSPPALTVHTFKAGADTMSLEHTKSKGGFKGTLRRLFKHDKKDRDIPEFTENGKK